MEKLKQLSGLKGEIQSKDIGTGRRGSGGRTLATAD
jgi:hypothetical protein